MENPLSYFEGNLLFTSEKKCWAIYEIPGEQYDLKSIGLKKGLFRRLLGFFWGIEKSARLLFLPESYTFEEHFEQIKEQASGPLKDWAHEHADKTQEWLEKAYKMTGGTKYRVFVSLLVAEEPSFWDSIKNAKDFIIKLTREPLAKTDRLLGLSGMDLLASELKMYQEMEDRLFNRMKKFISLIRPVEADVEWIVRRNFWKGIGTPPQRFNWTNTTMSLNDPHEDALEIPTGKKKADRVEVNGKKVIRPRLAEYMPMTEGEVDTKHNSRMVKVTQNIGGKEISCFSSYLVLTDRPDHLYIPGNEYIYQLHDLDFPVAVSMFIKPLDYQTARDKLRVKKMDINDQTEHTAESQESLPLNLQESIREAAWLEKDMDDNKFPMLDTSWVFEVYANDENTLLQRIDALKLFYKGMHFELVVPAGEQWQLFNEFMPCGERLCSSDYVHRVTPHVLAASMIVANKKLGDNTGPFIGTTGIMNMPVYFDLSRGPRINRSGSGAIIGSLGGGKSYTANLLTYLATINGGKALIFDPKGDRSDWKEHLLELEDELDIIRLQDRPEYWGTLDPWGMFDDPNEAANIAISITTFLANIKTDDPELDDLTEAIERVKLLSKKKRSMITLRKELEGMQTEGAQKLARRMFTFSKLPLAKLIFHDGELNTISTKRRVTVLQIDNLKLPDASTERKDYDIPETLAVAFMMGISAFATKFAEEDPTEFTVVILDEFWALQSTKEGKRLAERLIRTGRYFFAAIIIITQNAKDLLDSSIKNNLGFKVAFKSTDDDEVRDVLKFFNLEQTPENIEMIKSLENGRPLFQDLDGHCGIVNVQPVFSHLDRAFDTTPGKKKKVS